MIDYRTISNEETLSVIIPTRKKKLFVPPDVEFVDRVLNSKKLSRKFHSIHSQVLNDSIVVKKFGICGEHVMN